MSSSSRSMREGRRRHAFTLRDRSGRHPTRRGVCSARWARSGSARRGFPRGTARRRRSSCSLERGYDACEIDFEGGFWMDYPWAERLGELARDGRDRPLGARPARRLPRAGRARQEAPDGDRNARPFGRRRSRVRRRAGRPPPRLPARPHARGGAGGGRRAARRAARAPGGERPRGSVRRRGDGPCPRARHAPRTSSRSPRSCPGSGRCSTSPTCTRSPTAAFTRGRAVRGGAARPPTGCSSPARPSTCISATSSSRTATRRSTCPTARGRSERSRSRRRWPAFERPATVISESPDEASSQAIRAILLGTAAG